MSARVTKAGTYELFEAEEGERVLELEDDQFLLTDDSKGEDTLSLHDGEDEFKQDELLDRGDFKFFEFDDEDNQDPILLLQRKNHFQVVNFAAPLPAEADEQVVYDMTEERIGLDEVLDYITNLESGSGGRRRRTPRTETFTNISLHLSALDFPAPKQQIMEFARRMQAPDRTVSLLASLESRNYHSVTDVRVELGDVQQTDELGIQGKSSKEVIERIEAMEPAALQKLKRYEQRHGDRQDVLDAIDKRLNR